MYINIVVLYPAPFVLDKTWYQVIITNINIELHKICCLIHTSCSLHDLSHLLSLFTISSQLYCLNTLLNSLRGHLMRFELYTNLTPEYSVVWCLINQHVLRTRHKEILYFIMDSSDYSITT